MTSIAARPSFPVDRMTNPLRMGVIALLLALPLAAGALLLSLMAPGPIMAAPAGVITVTSPADDLAVNGNCTLREAIEAANTNASVDDCLAGTAGQDIIVLAPLVTYSLSLVGAGEDGNQTGDLDVLESLIISAPVPTAHAPTIDGAGLDRIFHLDPALTGVNLTLDRVRLINGVVTGIADGGAIKVEQGRLALLNSSVENNLAGGSGGGLYVDTGYVYLSNSRVISNSASDGGGIYTYAGVLDVVDSQINRNRATFVSGNGGGIYTYGGNVHLSNSVIYSNSTMSEGGGIYGYYGLVRLRNNSVVEANIADYGGGLLSDGGGTFIYNSSVVNNVANHEGGGIVSNYDDYGGTIMVDSLLSGNRALAGDGGGFYVYGAGAAVISNTLVGLNSATGEGGGIYHNGDGTVYLDGSSVFSNTSNTNGGGIYANTAASVVAIESIIAGNASRSGGGIYMDITGTLTVQGSEIRHNTAISTGGGIHIEDSNPTLIQSSSLVGNSAHNGGALSIGMGRAGIAIENSTLSQNSAVNNGGAIFSVGDDVQISLNHATIVSNKATSIGGGLYVTQTTGVVAQNSIMAGNGAGQCAGRTDFIVSAGYNLLDVDCPLDEPSDQTISVGALFSTVLGPLAANGGIGKSHDLLAGSPAVDAAATDTCLPVDQRGASRSQGNGCDVGAVESVYVQTAPVVPTNIINVNSFDDDFMADNNCTLREAIEAANSNSSVDSCPAGMLYTSAVDVIVLPAGIYSMSIPIGMEDFNVGGDYDILESVQIVGAGSGATIIDGNSLDRIFHVSPNVPGQHGVDFTLTGVTLRNGDSDDGGAIFMPHGSLTLSNTEIVSNSATLSGGGIGTEHGQLWLNDVDLIDNAANDGGGVFHRYATANWWTSQWTANKAVGGGGGGHLQESVVQIDGTAVGDNRSGLDGGGIGSTSSGGGILRIGSSSIYSNTVSGSGENGGGIYLYYGWMDLVETTVSYNEAGGAGGGIYRYHGGESIRNSHIDQNRALSRQGGGIYSYYGAHIIQASQFTGNSAGKDGGGLFIEYGFLLMEDSIAENNRADGDGGGLFNYETTSDIRRSIFRDNWAGDDGGGIDFYFYASHIIRDTLIEGNTAVEGGGLFTDDEPNVYMVNSTVYSNTAKDGGGLFSETYDYSIIELENTTVSGNRASGTGGGIYSEDPLYLNFVTVVTNTAVMTGGGVFLNDENAVIQNSIIAGNRDSGGETSPTANCDDTGADDIATNGHNVFVTGTGCTTDQGDTLIPASDVFPALISVLADNDGSSLPDGSVIQSHFPAGSSVAIDAGESLLCPAMDQRGVARPFGANCDAGAVEWNTPVIYLPFIIR